VSYSKGHKINHFWIWNIEEHKAEDIRLYQTKEYGFGFASVISNGNTKGEGEDIKCGRHTTS
jgi:hypothetical protein